MRDGSKKDTAKNAILVHEKTLVQQVEFYQLLVESIQDYAIFMLDSTGHVASWNKGAQKLKGYTPNEIIGKHFSAFYTPEDMRRNKPARELEKAMKDGRIEDEYWRVRKDGSRFWANVVITALRDDAGELVGFAKVTRDLTDRKSHEVALKKTNAGLKRQQAELETLNAAKDEFIAIASHQLRTPATGVKQFLGLLIEGYAGELTKTQKQFLRRAYDTNCRQIDLVNSLLRVAQVDAGKVVLFKRSTDIAGMIIEITEEMKGTVEARNQTMCIECAAETPIEAVVDPARFRMVLENLMDNASKYTPNGGTITIGAETKSDELTVWVRDTGVGVSGASVGKLFTKFSRLPNSLSDTVSGSGLGLYWVKKIVELHDGVIEVVPNEGEGSTFTLRLPGGRP